MNQDTETILALCQLFNFDLCAIVGKRRHYWIRAQRHQLWRMLRQQGWSWPRIGRAFGRRHATILAAVNGKKRNYYVEEQPK